MDIAQLRNFLKTVETMNFTRAAEGLFISRQALRQSLSALERELGQPLFETEHNRLALTQYGEYLARACADAVTEFDRMEEDVNRFFRQDTVLRFAYSVSMSPYALPSLEQFVLRDFAQKFPHINLQVIPCPADEVLDLLERREIDLACVLQMPTHRKGCETTVIRSSPLTVTFGRSSPFFGRDTVTLEELSTVPLIGMGSLDKITRSLWEDCQKQGITLNYQAVPNTIDALYLARHNKAVCLNTVPPNWSGEPQMTLVEDYTWDITLLCPRKSENYHSAQLLAAYINDHYQRLFADPNQQLINAQTLVTQ